MGRRVGPPPDRLRAEPHPGTRASRPQPYSSLEVVERQRKVAASQPPCRRERHWPVRMKGKAPLPFDPSGGVGQGCAGLMCGRDARVPGWASSTQQTGNMIYTTPRNRARGRLQASLRLPLEGGVIFGPLAKADAAGADAELPSPSANLTTPARRRHPSPCPSLPPRFQSARRPARIEPPGVAAAAGGAAANPEARPPSPISAICP